MALVNLSGQWINQVHRRQPLTQLILFSQRDLRPATGHGLQRVL